METLRAFIAIELPDEVRLQLHRLQQRLRKSEAEVCWVPPDSMHLTLAFLGEITQEHRTQLTRALQSEYARIPAFQLTVEGTGFFGSSCRPRVIWAGLQHHETLSCLYEKTAHLIRSLDLPVDSRPFSPHLTLGRVKSAFHTDLLLEEIHREQKTKIGLIPVESLKLMQSRLTPHGAVYSVLQDFRLNTAPAS